MDEFTHNWVFKRNAWDHLELTGHPGGLRAVKVVSCMDNCTLVGQCPDNTKKPTKAHSACVASCKLEKCPKTMSAQNCSWATGSARRELQRIKTCATPRTRKRMSFEQYSV